MKKRYRSGRYDQIYSFHICENYDSSKKSSWTRGCVYGEPASNLRWVPWDDWIQTIKQIQGPIVCMGDGNCLWDANDKKCVTFPSKVDLRLGAIILNEANLCDLGYWGQPFTWSNR